MKKVSELFEQTLVFCTVAGATDLNQIHSAKFLKKQGFGGCRVSETRDGYRLNLSVEEAENLNRPTKAPKVPPLVLTAFEFGYKCCEKGMNLDEALIELRKTFERTFNTPVKPT